MIKIKNQESNKLKLTEKGVNSFARKCIYKTIQKEINNIEKLQDSDEKLIIGETGTILVHNCEVDFEITEFHWDEETGILKIDYKITDVEVYDSEQLLEEAGIDFETSLGSESLYFKLNNKEYRVSTHKRPAIVEDLLDYEHDYENETICKNEKEMYFAIKEFLEILNG